MSSYEVQYEYNNSVINITDTREVHEALQNDHNYFEEYISQNESAPELIAISENNLENGNIGFAWTTKATTLFLQAYAERKESFRNPKNKKRELWGVIVDTMKNHGYINVDVDILDRKMRNMKRSYKNIKDNNKKSTTGRGRVSWQYFDTFEEIFSNDESLYNLRKKQLEVEERRVTAIEKLAESLDTTNTIQKERNELLKKYLFPENSSGTP